MIDNLSARIINWVEQTDGWFSYLQLDEALGITHAKDKNTRRVIMCRLCKEEKVWRVKKHHPLFHFRIVINFGGK